MGEKLNHLRYVDEVGRKAYAFEDVETRLTELARKSKDV